MIARLVKAAVPIAITAAAIKLNECLHTFRLPWHAALIISAALAAFAIYVVEELVHLAKRNSLFIRKILDKRARFEGDWFVESELGARMPYGCVSIDYNPETDAYIYSGAAYDNEGKLGSEWSCESLQFEIPHNKVRFVARTSIKGEGGAQHDAYGWISFKKKPLRRHMQFARGDGFYTVIGKPEFKGEFNLERLDRRYVKRVLGRRHINSKGDMAKLVHSYHLAKVEKEGTALLQAPSSAVAQLTEGDIESDVWR